MKALFLFLLVSCAHGNVMLEPHRIIDDHRDPGKNVLCVPSAYMGSHGVKVLSKKIFSNFWECDGSKEKRIILEKNK